jgi:hypothetical protein
MSISLAVIVIVFADLALVGGVGYVMSQARRLRPHRGETMRRAARTFNPRSDLVEGHFQFRSDDKTRLST